MPLSRITARAIVAGLSLIAACACWCVSPPVAAPPRHCDSDALGDYNCDLNAE